MVQLLGVAFWGGSQGFRGWRLAQAASQGCTPVLGSVQDSRAIWGKSPGFCLTSPFGKGTACPQRAAPVSPGALKGPLRKPWEIKPFCHPSFLSTSSPSGGGAGSAKTLRAEPLGCSSSPNQPELLLLSTTWHVRGAGGRLHGAGHPRGWSRAPQGTFAARGGVRRTPAPWQ